ncbi:MAG: hypothetical protein WDN67_04200 [Candidatus Moraniibacteriota bacterium]
MGKRKGIGWDFTRIGHVTASAQIGKNFTSRVNSQFFTSLRNISNELELERLVGKKRMCFFPAKFPRP